MGVSIADGIIIGISFYIALNVKDILTTNEMILEYLAKIYKEVKQKNIESED